MPKSQLQIWEEERRKIASLNDAMLDALYGANPITDDELRALIEKRPSVYGRFAGYLGKR